MSDDELIARAEQALAAALAIEPSAGFKTAVRRRVADSPVQRALPLAWLAPAAAACAAALAVAALHRAPRAAPLPAPAPRQSTPRSVAPPLPVADARVAPPLRRPQASSRRPPLVVVPPGEARRIEAYYEAVSRIEAAPARVAADELAITPIEIEPLPDAEPGGGSAPGHSRGL